MKNNVGTILLWFAIALSCPDTVLAQTPSLDKCTAIGQTPATAFPVCATTVFEQKSVPNCSTSSIYVPGCSRPGGTFYADESPYWYKFTCYQSGTLGFLIEAMDQGDDYDWQLWDITGKDPGVVFSNNDAIVVSGNWAGTYGNTGASENGAPYINCASDPHDFEPSFARMPNIIEGHQYLLMVSHFSGSVQSGYNLSFGGGTAVITDPTMPELHSLDYSCDGTTIYIKVNKKILRETVALDGSDFVIDGLNADVVSAQPAGVGFDTDSIILKLDQSLPPGDYQVVVKQGTDGNTLIDNCGNFIPEGNQLPLSIIPLQPTPMDSLAPLSCAPAELELVFRKKIDYESVISGGQKFTVTGPAPVAVTGTHPEANNDGLTKRIFLTLDNSLVHGGTYTITLHRDRNGSTFYDECGQETPEGTLSFEIKDTVNADFSFDIDQDCDRALLSFNHDGDHEVNSWEWQMDYNGKSELPNPTTTFSPPFGDKSISLKVSNGFCSDTIQKIVPLGPELRADFKTNPIICPEDSAVFANNSSGHIVSYAWDFGDGTTSTDEVPEPKTFPQPLVGPDKKYPVSLTVTSDIGCESTFQKTVRVLISCFITVPNAFTPNGDGLNDYLYPLNAFKADSLVFRIYNRYGQKIFESHNWEEKWNGRYKGEPQESGEYAWTLEYTDITNGKRSKEKGKTMLIR